MTSETKLFPPAGDKAALEAGDVLTPRFGPDGTIACVTVDADSGQVLMVAYMNAESLALTIETGEGWYWSRSRGELWHKGATSGNVQKVVELLTDCDQDALVLRVRVEGAGATCHTGQVSCFYRRAPLGQKAAEGPVRLEQVGGERRFDPAEVYGHKH
ncbi:phosphoribosyl-AMP cyclohydrolase [Pleomorphomonas diazotrophica]|uniref:Phosphoribosyl-AMP cyclohydrolase n=1 Tax=Pleomorphomonas diazotrophica TaxID=1166257 RepID=A0A1I4QWK9_9HYPH|nr:phosphoribosyl-AMP cyclohydrolase [Pleomorphomonas diazotrophica]PKR90395.1 phosphoribosyl-AMP cyclohydrolase [Pleomorphomonas diazotrophica]SFM44080.1 phosphoribosyl-AMP cyclohydrolase [Pleomorphomonas diazotrophica]